MKARPYAITLALAIALGAPAQNVAQPSPSIHGAETQRFVGAWRLVRIEAPDPNGRRLDGSQPKGMLIYTRDGHMSVQLMYPRESKVPDNEYVRNGYEASFGRYDVNEAAHTVTHHVEGSITGASLVGKDLPRVYRFTADGHLILRSADPKETWSATWEHE